MKKYLKELIIAGIELSFLFLFPLIPMGNKDAHIILLLVITLIVGIVGIAISDKKIKFLFPVFTTIMVVPTMFMYYEPRVYGNIFWMFVFSLLATIIGEILRLIVLGVIKFVKKIKK
ncbi:MAG: hypothetical protein IIW72_00775 [Clostridia bacterium]|nr:hypothetical protein [Clostridia bacterium]